MKKISITALTSSFTVLFSLPAFADQCAYISKEQALLAASRLNVGQTVYYLCEPCGETEPQEVAIESLSVGTVDYENFWQVKVNNEGIDLAYVFIESGVGGQPINLAAVSGCPASQISTVLPNGEE